MIVCICNALGEAACRRTACLPECRTVGCVYRLQGARIRCGRCLPHMHALLTDVKAAAVAGGAGAGPPATVAPDR